MANLHADLRTLIGRHLPSKSQEAQDILMRLTMLLQDAEAAEVYQYRHHPSWDTTWMDLDESQLGVVLERGHTVERQALAGDWEAVTEEPA